MATDQEIRDAGFKYIPQQKYLLNPFQIPTPDPVTDQGIVATNAFTDSGGDNNIGGNLFGYGTAVKPGDKSVITSGPYAGQSGYYGSLNYRGGLPGDIVQKGPGRYFQYDNSGNFYKDYSIQPETELPSWMKAGLAFLPGGRFLGNYIENKMNPLGPMTQEDIDKSQGGSYGIAGLSDTQKQYYDALASQGFLYDGPGGIKTLDGKNFSKVDEDTINDYFKGKIGRFGSIEEYEDYISKDPIKRRNLGLILNQYKTLKGINDFNFQKQKEEFDKPGGTGEQVANLQKEIDSGKYSGGSDFAQQNQAAVGGGEAGRAANTDNDKSTGTSQGYSQHYARGGLASIL